MPTACRFASRLTTGEAHDNRLADKLLSRLKSGTMLLADRGYDADWIRALAAERGVWANIPPRCNRNDPICFSPYLYRARNLVERFFNKIKQCRRVATRYDKLAANYLAFVQFAYVLATCSVHLAPCGGGRPRSGRVGGGYSLLISNPLPPPQPSPHTQVGLARLAQNNRAEPGQARVPWGRERTADAAWGRPQAGEIGCFWAINGPFGRSRRTRGPL